MPGGNRMGPVGIGPWTGRGAGSCGGYRAPGFMTRGRGTGLRRGGFGRGMFPGVGLPYGMQYGYAYQPDPDLERDYLTNQARALRNQLSAIDKRLAELEAGEKKTV